MGFRPCFLVLALYALCIFAGRISEDYPKRQTPGNRRAPASLQNFRLGASQGSTKLKAKAVERSRGKVTGLTVTEDYPRSPNAPITWITYDRRAAEENESIVL